MQQQSSLLKTIGNVILGLVLLAAALGIAAYLLGYFEKPRTSTSVTLLWDVTEDLLPKPHAKAVVPLYNIDNSPNDGASFTFRYTSEKSLNPETMFSLAPAEAHTLVNMFERKAEIAAFTTAVTAFIDSVVADTVPGRAQSSIYIPLAETLNKVAADHTSNRKVVLVYSDLKENSSVISFYDPNMRSLLSTDPKAIQERLLGTVALTDLHGIEVLLLYEPKNADDDRTYRMLSQFYKSLLEGYGARVTIAANV